jgi:hypothetical protein
MNEPVAELDIAPGSRAWTPPGGWQNTSDERRLSRCRCPMSRELERDNDDVVADGGRALEAW